MGIRPYGAVCGWILKLCMVYNISSKGYKVLHCFAAYLDNYSSFAFYGDIPSCNSLLMITKVPESATATVQQIGIQCTLRLTPLNASISHRAGYSASYYNPHSFYLPSSEFEILYATKVQVHV